MVTDGTIDYDTANKYKNDISGYLQEHDSEWYNNASNLHSAAVSGQVQSANPFANMYLQPFNFSTVLKTKMPVKPTVDVHRRGGRLPAEDILWIEKNKNAAKTIAKLHEDILKLLKVGK